MKGFEITLFVIGGAVLIIAAYALLLWVPTYFLWNWIATDLFGLPRITFMQALGLLLLCGTLFKSSSSSCKAKCK